MNHKLTSSTLKVYAAFMEATQQVIYIQKKEAV